MPHVCALRPGFTPDYYHKRAHEMRIKNLQLTGPRTTTVGSTERNVCRFFRMSKKNTHYKILLDKYRPNNKSNNDLNLIKA